MGRSTSRRTSVSESAAHALVGEGVATVDAAWSCFHRSKSHRSRNTLVERYMPLVRAISRRISSELPGSIDMEDLVSAGTFGLMDAIERYDPRLGTRFEAYCAVRIRGAVLDELRHQNWMPRVQCRRALKVGSAADSLRGELGRIPTACEIAARSGLRLEDVRKSARGTRRHLSLTDSAGGEEKDARHVDILEARGLCDPAELLQEKERRDLLAQEVRNLAGSERLVVMLYYYEELTMKQIGAVLKVTESRVCQMHAGILGRLEQRLSRLDEVRSYRA